MTPQGARRAYRVLIRLAPRALRERHAAGMEDAFLDTWRQAQQSGRVARLAIWPRAAADLLLARFRGRLGARVGAGSRERRVLLLPTEIRSAVRSFGRQRAATTLVVVMLTLGIAANVVVFGMVNELFLEPFPFPDPDRLVYVNERAPKWNLDRTGINFPDFAEWQKGVRVFDTMALVDGVSLNLADAQGAERVLGARVTRDLFAVLRMAPILGRTFTEEEDRPNGPKVALISERMWRERFGAEGAVVGSTLQLNGISHQIMGVMPRTAEFPNAAPIWIPLAGNPHQQSQSYRHEGIARLKPGVTIAQANEDLVRAHGPAFERHDTDRVVTPFVEPLRDGLVGDLRSTATTLTVAVALLLSIACANVAAIMLARAVSRRREMGIRLAVGAGRWHLVRQLLVENALLSLAGGALGLAVGRWALLELVAAIGEDLPSWVTFQIDLRLALFAVGLTAATSILFGWAPALHAVRGDLRGAMQDSSSGTTLSPGGRRVLTWLVGAEFAFAAVLLIAGALLFRAFSQVSRTDPGFRPDHALTFRIALPDTTYADGPARLAFWEHLLDRIRAVPGVEAAGTITCPPFTCHWGNFVRVEGQPPPAPGDQDPVVLHRMASDGYFEAMGIRLAAGRTFDARDGRASSAPVAIVNETFVRTFWPGETNAVGRRLRGSGDDDAWVTVIGVARDVKHYGLDRPMRPGLYFPAPQVPSDLSTMVVVVRTTGEPAEFSAAARAIVRDADASLPIYRVQTVEAMLAESLRRRATYSWMLAVFAALAVVLALGGAYGVASYLVTQRRREIGIRMAMGARDADIVRTVLRRGFVIVAAGTAVGLALATSGASLLADLLSGVSPRDPAIVVSAVALLAAAGLLAHWIPARRAARVDPVQILRSA